MYIHAGEDVMIRSNDVIAILERETVESSLDIQFFLERHQAEVINLSQNDYKSLIITDPHVYFSPIASGTLKKRLLSQNGYEILI